MKKLVKRVAPAVRKALPVVLALAAIAAAAMAERSSSPWPW